MTIVLVMAVLICGFGWLINHIVSRALIYYMKEKGYEPPTSKETKECVTYVVKHKFR